MAPPHPVLWPRGRPVCTPSIGSFALNPNWIWPRWGADSVKLGKSVSSLSLICTHCLMGCWMIRWGPSCIHSLSSSCWVPAVKFHAGLASWLCHLCRCTQSCAQEHPTLGLMLYCHELENLKNFFFLNKEPPVFMLRLCGWVYSYMHSSKSWGYSNAQNRQKPLLAWSLYSASVNSFKKCSLIT